MMRRWRKTGGEIQVPEKLEECSRRRTRHDTRRSSEKKTSTISVNNIQAKVNAQEGNSPLPVSAFKDHVDGHDPFRFFGV